MNQGQSKSVADDRFVIPQSVEEAFDRRTVLKNESLAIQRKLTGMADCPERRRMIDIIQLKQAELSLLRDWLRSENLTLARSVAGSEQHATDMKVAAKQSVHALIQLVDAQQLRIRELEHQITGLESVVSSLRSRLASYEPDAGVLSAPGVDIDQWREQL